MFQFPDLECVFFLFLYGDRRIPLNPFTQLQNTHVTLHLSLTPLPHIIMFEQHISSHILFHHHHNKIPSRNLYLRQPHRVIQLVEVASPPPRRISSVINSSSAAPSSSSSSSSFSQEQQEEEDAGEEESVGSSYCSSDMPPDEIDVPFSPRHMDTLSGRMKRVLLWREQSPHLISGIILPPPIYCLVHSFQSIRFTQTKAG